MRWKLDNYLETFWVLSLFVLQFERDKKEICPFFFRISKIKTSFVIYANIQLDT